MGRFLRRFSVLSAVAVLLVAMFPGVSTARSANPVVMTRNLYLGADLTPLIIAPGSTELLQAGSELHRGGDPANLRR